MILTVLVYSGRPNPTWALAAAEAEAISVSISQLKPLGGACAAPANLGYSGVEAAFEEHGRRRELTFIEGVAYEGRRCWADENRGIERRLIDTGRGRFDPAILPAELR